MDELKEALEYVDNLYEELLSKFDYDVNEDGTYTIYGVTSDYGKDKNYKIIVPPNTKRIAVQAFESLYIEEVILPEGLEEIDNYAFYFCTNLRKINFPSSLKRIGINAFYSCNRLEEVNLNDGLEEIGDSAFTSCDLIEKVIIPETVVSVGYMVFERCSNLHYILTNLKERPSGWNENFYDDFDVTYYQTLEVIYGSINVPKVDLDDYERIVAQKLSDFQYEVLENKTYRITGLNKKDATIIVLPGKTSIIGEQAFQNNRNIRKVFLNYGIRRLESEAFELCTNLQEIRIPTSLRKIDFRVFNKCRYLKEIELPRYFECCQYNAFWGCTSLETIYVRSRVMFSTLDKNIQDCKAKVVRLLPSDKRYKDSMKKYLKSPEGKQNKNLWYY